MVKGKIVELIKLPFLNLRKSELNEKIRANLELL